MNRAASPTWFPALALLLAAALVARAIEMSHGTYHATALLLVLAGLASATVGVLARPGARVESLCQRLLIPGGVFVLGWFLLQFHLADRDPRSWYSHKQYPIRLPVLFIGLYVAFALAVAGLAWPRRSARVLLPLLLVLYLVLASWLVRSVPSPRIDVYDFQSMSCDALLKGQNPYAITFPNRAESPELIYGPAVHTRDRLLFGYPYPPLSLLLILPAHAAFGDVRYAHVGALVLSAALIGYSRATRASFLAGALLLLMPTGFLVLEMSWTEPQVVLMLALVMFCAARCPKLTPWAFGLLLATKQYAILLAPLAVLLLPAPFRWRDLLRFGLKALAAAAIVTLPLALWDVRAFLWSAVKLQSLQPFRDDALSVLAWWKLHTGQQLSVGIAFAVTLPAMALMLWRSSRSAAGFAGAVTFVFLAFFVFNKQAFCNYYFFTIGAACCALAGCAARGPVPVSDESHGTQ